MEGYAQFLGIPFLFKKVIILICETCNKEYSETVYPLHVERCVVNPKNPIAFESMDWKTLKQFASEKGIEIYKKTKEEIINSLNELEGV